jgi:tetratricopeptide (TPR) repeat protein
MRGALLLAAAFLVGCAGEPVARAPAKRQQAIEANNRAAAHFGRGDYEAAIAQYQAALELERSVENEDGIAANLINLSIAHQRRGDRAASRAAVAEILESPLLAWPPRRVAEAALRDAILKLDADDAGGAAGALGRARAACPAPCALAGKLDNVEAQLAHARGEHDVALAAATRALSANRGRGDRDEAANSLRLAGAALLEKQDFQAAERSLAEALQIDKELAVPSRIYRDLALLGRCAAGRSDAGQARAYYARALAVARASRDERAVAEVTRLAAALPN